MLRFSRCAGSVKRCAAGFTYVGLLIFIAILALTAASTLQVGALLQRRVAEQDLLAIGKEYQQALISYAKATPLGQNPLPRSFEDLLKDPRYPETRRHLRQVYIDPMTGTAEWGIVTARAGGGIAGIYSLSEASPIKIGNFLPPFEAFNNKTHYRDWIFSESPGALQVSQ
ncbi:MAG TPA: type II secretion system protein [Duganella sp.]|nr:type II secretion system protein [Duganella sp.]